MDNGFVLSWKKSRMRHDRRRVKYTMIVAPQRYHGKPSALGEGEASLRTLVERFYELLGTKASERKLARDTAIVEQLLGEGFDMHDIGFAVEWAVGSVKGVKSFGLIPYIMHQAMKARSDGQGAEEAKREAEARIDEQLRREQAERDRRQRLVELRASLPADTLEALRRRAEEALATDGANSTRLGYDVLVKIKLDELLEREFMPTDVSDDGGHGRSAVT
jgi:hypothetical protein